MWKRTLAILSAVSMLTACASGPPPTPVTTPIYLGNADTDCPNPPPPKSGKLGDLVQNHKESMDLYHECKASYRQALKRANLRNPESKTK